VADGYVAVSGNDSGDQQVIDDGTVAFCNSDETIDPASVLEPDAIIAQYTPARVARGFSWAVPNVGEGPHELVVKARLDLHVGDDAMISSNALAVFGKRLLVVEPTNIRFNEQPVNPQL
jgi:hypothetical protein